MDFNGQVWFSFRNPDVWNFYRFVRELASSGVSVNLDWVPLHHRDEEDAMATFLAIREPDQRGRYLHAMLGLIHLEGQDFDDDTIVGLAVSAAGLGAVDAAAGMGELSSLAADARSLGVAATPTLYRHGPASHIRLTEAAVMGDAATTATTILSVADDDGIWGVAKP